MGESSKTLTKSLFEHDTRSLCPECSTPRLIPAKVYEEDGKVWMRKNCEEHGEVRELYWGSSELYQKAKRFDRIGMISENPAIDKENPECPTDCGLCYEHTSQPALVNIVITNRCDLNCWYCFFYAEKAGYVYESSLGQIRTMVKTVRNNRPIPGNAIQLTGGEPTLREDLVDIIRICKEEGIDHVQLNTDAIRLSRDPSLAQKVRKAGVNVVYMSMDGVTPKTNPKNYWEVPGAIENCRKAGLSIVFVPTVIKTVNDNEVGAIVRFAQKNMDTVRGITYQPVSLVGRMSREEREKHRITIPDVIERIEEQTNGEIAREDFFPVPYTKAISEFVEAITGRPKYEMTSHFACGMATYVFNDGGKLVPISRFVDLKGAFEYFEEKADEIEEWRRIPLVGKPLSKVIGVKNLLGLRKFIDKEKEPEGLNLYRLLVKFFVFRDYKALGEIQHRSLLLTMMHFQDKYNWDEERTRRCSVLYSSPDGRLIPFCTFNVIPEVYRDRIQRNYGMTIEKWEQRNGRKISSDFYKRDPELIQSAPRSLI